LVVVTAFSVALTKWKKPPRSQTDTQVVLHLAKIINTSKWQLAATGVWRLEGKRACKGILSGSGKENEKSNTGGSLSGAEKRMNGFFRCGGALDLYCHERWEEGENGGRLKWTDGRQVGGGNNQ
jgi:hypothetical protein